MQYLQSEIEKYNSNMQLYDLPRWLARDRQNKVTSSVVLTFNNQNQASNALRGVNIAGRHCNTEIFASVRPTRNVLIVRNLEISIINAKVRQNAIYAHKVMKRIIMNAQHASLKSHAHMQF